jgi:hypothetical protein
MAKLDGHNRDTQPSAGPAEVRRYTPYVETVTHSDGVSNDSIWDEPRARMRPWMHGEWVLASDYDALAARYASQALELAERDARIAELRDELVAANMPQLAVIGTVTHYDSEALLLRAEAAEQSLAAMRERESVIYDGHRVLTEVKANAKAAGRTSPENVSDVLDAIARIWKEPT